MAEATWVVTRRDEPWQDRTGQVEVTRTERLANVIVQLDQPGQVIEGFGACFNEMGWASLSRLSAAGRGAVLREIFSDDGAALSLCRMPVGANDFALDWYSYDEVSGDLALEHFSIEHDDATLVPFIQAAQAVRPDLRLWASPWCPPSWMKTNNHYACAAPSPAAEHTTADNGLTPDRQIAEGEDGFRLEPDYLEAYARYFGRFVDAYRQRGIDISMVMPQNEFNSNQVYPSCTWTPAGLVAFLRHLLPQMSRRGVEVFLGTVERGNDALVEEVLADPQVGPALAGVGFQRAGKRAVGLIHHAHPRLRIYQTEQECGDGRNDWRYARYAWTMMRHYLTSGASAYDYWNIALDEGGVSRWGWSQNSLVSVDPASGTYRFNHEYYVLKHLSHFVRPGARWVPTLSYTGHEDVLAFVNPDGSVVVAARNDMAEDMPVTIGVGGVVLELTLPADCLSTVVLPA